MTRLIWVAFALALLAGCATPIHYVSTPGAPSLPPSENLDLVHALAPPAVHGPELGRIEGAITNCGFHSYCEESDCDKLLMMLARVRKPEGASLLVVFPIAPRPYDRFWCSGIVYGPAQ